MKNVIHPKFQDQAAGISDCITNFESKGEMLGEAVRNKIKVFDLDGLPINIKAFKKPNILNRLIYTYLRKSKACRSYEYANILLANGIGTPQPIAYFENTGISGLRDSYYISEQLAADLMYRDLTTNPDFPDREKILRQYTQFAFGLHEKGIEFIDNTSGNTLVKKNISGDYDFYLVDLNRMNFHEKMPFGKRMENLAKLTTVEDILQIMSDEYAICSGIQYSVVYQRLKSDALRFQENFNKRRKLKKKLKFWKK